MPVLFWKKKVGKIVSINLTHVAISISIAALTIAGVTAVALKCVREGKRSSVAIRIGVVPTPGKESGSGSGGDGNGSGDGSGRDDMDRNWEVL